MATGTCCGMTIFVCKHGLYFHVISHEDHTRYYTCSCRDQWITENDDTNTGYLGFLMLLMYPVLSSRVKNQGLALTDIRSNGGVVVFSLSEALDEFVRNLSRG